MAWNVEIPDKVKKQLKELDVPIRRRILKFLDERIRTAANPRALGEALHGSELGNFWKYRIGDYRLICHIEDQTVTVTVIKIGHRRDIYR
ncbi:type II toxin-antitoxin system RelE family toxin [Methylocaldum gracile subsp. desertum]|uniref:type II toxin-antitoxin system RelE family toxin n=1 Tax=Methylocaldum sp. GT1BW TaxID=3438964 RepID=UPI003DA08AD8